MKLSFINTSTFMIRVFQLVLLGGMLFGLFALLFIKDTSTSMTFGPIDIAYEQDLTEIDGIDILPIESDVMSPKLIVDEARLTYYVHGWSPKITIAILFTIGTGLLLYALQQLIYMIRSLGDGNPFIRTNVWRIYILATIIYLVPIFKLVFYLINYLWIKSNFVLEGLQLNWHTPEYGQWVIFGTLLITIGKIFEQGIKLREEQELTV